MQLGSWWLAKVESLENETEVFSCLANRTQSSNRAVGGKLIVTNRRILFLPHLLDASLGGQTMTVSLGEINGVGIEPAGGDTFGGGLRDRLRVDSQASIELFVVNKLQEVVDLLRSYQSKYLKEI
jgi:hypothetical protein